MIMLKELFQLQAVEAAERQINEDKRNSQEYQELRRIRASFEAKKQQYLRLGEELQHLHSQLAVFPAQISAAQQKLADEQKAVYDGSVSSTKALAAREAQAAAVAEKIEELQEQQNTLKTDAAQKQETHEQLKLEMEQQYAQFRTIKSAYQQQEEQRQQQIAELEQRKAEIVAQLPPETLSWYEKEKGRFNGAPVAMLNEHHVCSGCHTMAPPITYQRSLQHQQTFCEKCGRILFIDEA